MGGNRRHPKPGSVLSPVLFNIFIEDLLIQLKNSKVGIRIGPDIYSAIAYADDVTTICSTVPGLQKLINICEDYAVKWWFKFGIKKTPPTVGHPTVRHHKLAHPPNWFLYGNEIEHSDSLDVPGITFNNQGKSDCHCNNRIQRCRGAFYSLGNVGMCVTGLVAKVN